MDKNKKLEKFFEGKGFYIVLALCVAVIGISAFSIARNSNKTSIDNGMSLENREPEVTVSPDIGEAPEVNSEPPANVTAENNEVVSVWTEDDVWVEPSTWVWPVFGELERDYAVDSLAYDVTMADWRTHDGIDVAAEKGAEVRAAADGEVEKIYNDDLYGTTVIINHGGGIKTSYSNLADTPTVNVGDKVHAGDVIGSVGESALCEIGEASHLHLSMNINEKSVNPLEYLPEI